MQSGFATKTVAKPLSSLEEIRQRFFETGDADAALSARSDAVDEMIVEAFRTTLGPMFPQGMSVLAVGGFGRRELFPHSDVDLLLLVEREIQGDGPRQALSTFLRNLWDAGLRLSHSVHTISECCELNSNNVELSVSLIDQRLLTGDAALYEQLSSRLPRFFQAHRQTLIRHLGQLTESRHAKFHNTLYHLEPNIKETPGGMRDLHLVHWLAYLRGVEDETRTTLEPARAFISALRCRLHYKYGRDSNVLTFDAQEESSEDTPSWMRAYYRHARAINQAALRHLEQAESLNEGGLFRSFREWRSRLSNAEFSVVRERLYFKSPLQIASDPEVVLRCFEFMARHGIRLSLDAERRLAEHLPTIQAYFSVSRPIWPALRAILSQPNSSLALRSMHESCVLTAVFPEWREIDCLVVRDFYHRYTVDEHTIVTIEALEELRVSKDPARGRFLDLIQETEGMPLVVMALLFHDTGKSGSMEGHATASVKIAAPVLERIQMPQEQRETVLALIEQHLVLSAVMNSRDLTDKKTARDVADGVGTIERLKQLTLLTYADISAVNPEAMTPWRLEQLWRVYRITSHELTAELATDRVQTPPEHAEFVAGFPVRYLRTHTTEEIAAHAALMKRAVTVGISVHLEKQGGVFLATVVTKDRPGLLAALAGALASFGMNILKAEAFANTAGMVLDTFAFADPMRTLELNPEEIERLKSTLQRVAMNKEDVRRLLKGRSRPVVTGRAKVHPAVGFNNNASQSATLVEIVAEDRPGLLYDLASTFSDAGCSIDTVLIDTEAHRALDAFYVTCGGAKLSEDLQQTLGDTLRQVCA